jgi:hypothetical protein
MDHGTLSIAKIRLDGGTQPRETLDQATVDEYAEAMGNKVTFPDVTVFYDETDYWLVDGFHRVAAAKKKGKATINVEIRPGNLSEAQLYSFGVNKAHGLRRTNEDKCRAVKATLEHDLSDDWSDRRIAEHCGVDDKMVSRLRAEMVSGGSKSHLTKRVGKDGKTYDVSKTQEANKKRATKTTTSTKTTNRTVVETPTEADFVEEHEESKTAYVLGNEPEAVNGQFAVQSVTVTDGLGRPVPDALAPAFLLVNAGFDTVRNKIIAARTAWNEMQAELEAHPWVRRNADYVLIEDHIEKLRLLVSDLSGSGPFAPCVYCGAVAPADSRDACEGCRGSSWLSKDSYGRSPQLLRENAA